MFSQIASDNHNIGREEYFGHWGNCPIELLVMIFTNLDTKSLTNCMFVNKFWRDAVHYYCQHFRLWKQLVEDNISNKGAIYKEKSTLQWRDLLMNFFLWRNVNNASVSYLYSFNVKGTKSMKIYRDNLIVVCNDKVEYYDLINRKCIEAMDVKCLTYEESDYLVASLSRAEEINVFCSLYIQNKYRHIDCDIKQCDEFNLDVIGTYKLHSNCCYFVDMSNILWVSKTERCNFNIKALAKFYGPRNCIFAIHVFEETVYIVKNGGDVYYIDGLQFIKAFSLLLPSHNYDAKPFIFHKCSAAYRVPIHERFEIFELVQNCAVVIACPGLSALIEHGEIVIFGYEDGKIEIHSIIKLLSCINVAEKQFNIREYVNEEDGDYTIKAIDVYEDAIKHHLLIATNGNIHQIVVH